MAKIFFGCSMRGGYGIVSKEELAEFPNIIESLGHSLVSRHQTKEWEVEEQKLSLKDIHERDYEWLMEADIFISEISNPSLGVGAEIADISKMKKPVLCLFKKGTDDTISAYIRGMKGSKYVEAPFDFASYDTLEEAKEIIKSFIDTNI